MKAAAMSVWIFINLLCFGMCGYLYLIWSQYWLYIEKQRLFSTPTVNPQRIGSGVGYQETFNMKTMLENGLDNFNNTSNGVKNRRSALAVLWDSAKILQSSSKSSQLNPPTNIVRRAHGSPRFPNVHKPVLELDTEKYLCDDYSTSECEDRTTRFKDVLLKEFHRVLMDEGKVYKSGLDVHNTYNVKYVGAGSKVDSSRSDILCALGSVAVRTVTALDEPFRSQGFQIPENPLQLNRQFNTCAVVTSAGALLGSRLGEYIDSHDMVLRFNNAPTQNYTDDVGSKTTFRILNSQVVSKPEFNFLENPLFRNVSILIWDPANYSSTLDEWYSHPDFQLFPVYKRLLNQNKDADVHVLRPEVLWRLWAVLQDSSVYRLRKNPPSSGFLGLWFSLHRCNRVRMFEYVPSARATRRCHYHISRDDAGCTLGTWHPLAQEKALAERIRDNSDLDVFQRGFIDVPGFRNVQC